jgi:hypothetical protein
MAEVVQNRRWAFMSIVPLTRLGPRHIWRAFRGTLDVFHLLPAALAVVICTLLWTDPQVQELYLSYLQEPNPLQVVCAIVGFVIVSLAIYGAHYLLVGMRLRENSSDGSVGVDRWRHHGRVIYSNYRGRRNVYSFLRWLQGIFGAAWACLPWLGIAFGLRAAAVQIIHNGSEIKSALERLSAKTPEIFSGDRIGTSAILESLMWGLAIVFLIACGLWWSLRRYETLKYGLSRRAYRYVLPIIFWALTSLLLALAAFLPTTKIDFVAFYRGIGPLATLSLEYLFFIAIFTGAACLSQKSRFPAVTLIATAIVAGAIFNLPFGELTRAVAALCAVLLIIAASSALLWESLILASLCILCLVAYHRDSASLNKPDPNIVTSTRQSAFQKPDNVQLAFQKWLGLRPGTPTPASGAARKPYPVFIIAAEGGGIYAAASAALFLAKIQDRQPCFIDHIFAISGVSGGAIGATIFQALAESLRPPSHDVASCAVTEEDDPTADGPLAKQISIVMRDDYFSPVVSAIIPDLLGEQWGRAETLERGFLESVDEQTAADLKKGYMEHWSGGLNPALVLNTTSAETGYRVAFAPFGLQGSADKSLYSFADNQFVEDSAAEPSTTKPQSPKKCSDSGKEESPSESEDVALMFSAVASARFPFILPPYSTLSKCRNRLNFVDGGYADNSGTETALDIYRAIVPENSQPKASEQSSQPQSGQTIQNQNSPFDVRIIVITSDDPLPDLMQINGTKYGDTIAPVSALLQVRMGLGDQAVARLCDYFQQAEKGRVDTECNTLDGKLGKVDLVKIQDQAYGLPMAWKISPSTVALIASLLGSSSYCKDLAAGRKKVQEDKTDHKEAADILGNSCVLGDVEKSLTDYYTP